MNDRDWSRTRSLIVPWLWFRKGISSFKYTLIVEYYISLIPCYPTPCAKLRQVAKAGSGSFNINSNNG